MNKISTLLLSGMLLISFQSVIAADYGTPTTTTSLDSQVRDANYEDFSYNISDEQLTKEAASTENLLEQDKKVSFWQKIVNSSHFSSKTATRTWIPINKAQ